MDIISSLPDDILCHILSFLPTKSAVACSFLSTRWRHLWAYVPVLDFDARLYGGPSPITSINASRQSEMIFRNFVSRVLLFNVMPYIRKFRLIYECHCRPVPIRTWFLVAISSHIQELEVDLCFSVRGDLVDLPRMLFTSSMLVTLKLSRMPLNVPSYVCFPSLKVLELRRIMYLHDNCIENLLSGCRTLEELVIEETAREKQKVVLINIHTLRSFWFGYRFVIDLMGDLPYKFIINAPNLEYFHVKGLISDVFEVRSLASLNNAYVDLRQTPISTQSYLSCYHRIFDLMEGLTNAKSVTLSGAAVQLLCESSNRALPRFSNLKQLAFGIDFDFCWKKILAEFIRCSCNLEAISLNNKQGFLRDMEELREMPIQPLPVNMLSYLKNILIDELYASFMPEYVEYMVQHVHVLKRLKINCHCPIMLRSQIGLPS